MRHDGRANPNQLVLGDTRRSRSRRCATTWSRRTRERAATDDLVIGLQLTHSGRFRGPNPSGRLSRASAYHHPVLDRAFGIRHDGAC